MLLVLNLDVPYLLSNSLFRASKKDGMMVGALPLLLLLLLLSQVRSVRIGIKVICMIYIN